MRLSLSRTGTGLLKRSGDRCSLSLPLTPDVFRSMLSRGCYSKGADDEESPSALADLASQRSRPADPDQRVFEGCPRGSPTGSFPWPSRTVRRRFGRRGGRAGWDGYTRHCNRDGFASRLVMAGVDLRGVRVLGGWRTRLWWSATAI